MYQTPSGKTYQTRFQYEDDQRTGAQQKRLGYTAYQDFVEETAVWVGEGPEPQARQPRTMSQAESYRMLPGYLRSRANLKRPNGGTRF